MRCCLLTFVTLVAVGLIGATLWFGALGLLGPGGGPLATAVARSGAPTPPPARPPATPPPAAPPPAAARQGPSAPAATGDGQLVRLTEAELTEALRLALAQTPNGALIGNPRVRIAGDRLELAGQVQGMAPLPIDFRLTGRLELRQGQPVLAIERLDGAGVPLPEPAVRRLEQTLNALTLVPIPAEIEVTRIEAGGGLLTVYGRRR